MNLNNYASSNLPGLMRTHTCGQLRGTDVGQEVILCGWMNKYRDLGGLHFIDLRDKYGITQLAFDQYSGDLNALKKFSLESVLLVKGKVRNRPENALNKNMVTGEVEVAVSEIKELSHAQEPPFLPHGKISATEDLRLKYRYLDLRSDRLQGILAARSMVMKKFREVLYSENFTEVETPILYKTTPEGARDYIVPSRVHPGKVYALPQSPQTLKQLLMIANLDKYFQICKCFRDEDLRADRQPEFSQVDIEVSFATQAYIKNLVTKLVKNVFGMSDDFEIPTMSYKDAMALYGTDKPDARFGLEHFEVTSLFKGSDFKVFSSVSEANGLIKAFFVPASKGEFSRKDMDGLTEVVKPHGGKGVAWFKLQDGEVTGGISKFINPQILTALQKAANSTENGTYMFFADVKASVAHACADVTRRHLGHKLNLIEKGVYKFLWVNEFPLLEYDDETKRFYACHHPFTMPSEHELANFMSSDPEKLKNMTADAYDIVCNGYEMGGGSRRIFDNEVQRQMFKVLGMGEEEVNEKFGFFVEALKYGTPPHAGIAFGLDRTVMLVVGTENIRDVIAFPKTNTATDLMSNCPSEAKAEQYAELKIQVLK